MNFLITAHIVIQIALLMRVLTVNGKTPMARSAWILVIFTLPIAGFISYLLIGEANVDSQLRRKFAKIKDAHPFETQFQEKCALEATIPNSIDAGISALAASINGYRPVAGNNAKLMEDSNSTIDAMIADVDASIHSVSVSFYIWLNDHNGTRFAEALIRAAFRGVEVRVMVDALGSRAFIASPAWTSLKQAGVKTAAALTFHGPIRTLTTGRIDLRNHRKLMIVDSQIAYVGSQNCADPEFRIKATFAPWVDIMVRFDGPIAQQNEHMFALMWMTETDEVLSQPFQRSSRSHADGIVVQAIGTGPTERIGAMSSIFVSSIYASTFELTISTPYFVPDEAAIQALICAVERGVKTTLILPARNDNPIVGAVSRGQYRALLEAGVEIFEFRGGLLHSKTLTADGRLTLIGSSNFDRRSLDLNFENNVLVFDPDFTRLIYGRQQIYLESSRSIDLSSVQKAAPWRRFVENGLGVLSPIL